MTKQTYNFTRRKALGFAGTGALFGFVTLTSGTSVAAKNYPIERSAAQWRKRLTKQQYYILREAGTERPYSSQLNDEKRAGTYHCQGCNNALYSSKTKFESGTGWPSFWKPLSGAIATKPDRSIIAMPRTEVLCSDCGGHLGHVFDDGPKPTGQRWCMNGAAMKFRAV